MEEDLKVAATKKSEGFPREGLPNFVAHTG